jgi:hypothetical protein
MTALRTSVYLDVCALCRPFDDQLFLRIRLETDAVNLIMSKVLAGQIILVVSSVHFAEIRAIPDNMERLQLLSIVKNFGVLLFVREPMNSSRWGLVLPMLPILHKLKLVKRNSLLVTIGW